MSRLKNFIRNINMNQNSVALKEISKELDLRLDDKINLVKKELASRMFPLKRK